MPKAPHVDHIERDLDVLVTKQGLADLRGLSPLERARAIIGKCVHPDYRPIMQEYLARSRKECFESGIGHEPHMLFKVFKMQQNLAEKGTLKTANRHGSAAGC